MTRHLDQERETYMARRLKELIFRYDRILICWWHGPYCSIIKTHRSTQLFPIFIMLIEKLFKSVH